MCLLSHSERGGATEPCARGAPRACCGACSRGSRRAALRSLGPVLGVDFPLFRLPGAVVTKHRKQGLKTTRVCSLMVLEARSLRSRCQWLGHAPSKGFRGGSLLAPSSFRLSSVSLWLRHLCSQLFLCVPSAKGLLCSPSPREKE